MQLHVVSGSLDSQRQVAHWRVAEIVDIECLDEERRADAMHRKRLEEKTQAVRPAADFAQHCLCTDRSVVYRICEGAADAEFRVNGYEDFGLHR